MVIAQLPWVLVISAGVVATIIGTLFGRWKIVADAVYGPAIDID